MKKYIVGFLMLGAFFMMLTGMPLYLLNVDPVQSAYALGYKGGHDRGRHRGFTNRTQRDNNGNGVGYANGGDGGVGSSSIGDAGDPPGNSVAAVPEPAMIALLGSGIAGIGIYSIIRRRRNRK